MKILSTPAPGGFLMLHDVVSSIVRQVLPFKSRPGFGSVIKKLGSMQFSFWSETWLTRLQEERYRFRELSFSSGE